MTLARKPIAQRIGSCLAAGLLAVSWMTAGAAQEASKQFIMHQAPKPIAAIQFEDGRGQPRSLSDFRGKIVLVNVWATWCIPCRREMPALDRLQATLGGPDFEVVALSIDRGGMDVVRKFFAEVGLQKLGMYRDNSGKAMRGLDVVGIPTTLLVDRAGREIGRLIGPAEWDAPDMIEFVKCINSREDDPSAQAGSKSTARPSCSGRDGVRALKGNDEGETK